MSTENGQKGQSKVPGWLKKSAKKVGSVAHKSVVLADEVVAQSGSHVGTVAVMAGAGATAWGAIKVIGSAGTAGWTELVSGVGLATAGMVARAAYDVSSSINPLQSRLGSMVQAVSDETGMSVEKAREVCDHALMIMISDFGNRDSDEQAPGTPEGTSNPIPWNNTEKWLAIKDLEKHKRKDAYLDFIEEVDSRYYDDMMTAHRVFEVSSRIG